MSWTGSYRLALWLLPPGLRRKHGPAMEALFAREIGHARERGRLHGALAGAAGVWDVVQRGAYECVRLRANPGAPPMTQPPHPPRITTRQLLRRHAVSFSIAFVALTASLLALFAARQVPRLSARGEPAGAVVELLLLAVPFVAAMTIPMAVLVAVLREFTRLGAEGALAAARRERDGVRRLVVPVLAAAVGVAALALVVTAEIVPRANVRLSAVLAGQAAVQGGRTMPSDREMTIGELRAAARNARPESGAIALAHAAQYEVEVQKKLALPAACVILALVGMAIALRVPRGGAGLVIVASCAVFGAYYVFMITGEDLADRLVVSPVVGMWGANALLLAAALLVVWRSRSPLGPRETGPVAIGG